MAQNIQTHLMFEDNTEEAMDFYVSLFPDSQMTVREHYGDGINKDKLQQGHFSFDSRGFIAIDSPVEHDVSFTPAVSILVDCDSIAEREPLFSKLSDNGNKLMSLDDYDFSQRFGWLSDRFDVSWQLNLT